MTDTPIEYETRMPPQDPVLVEAARARPGAWVYEIDRVYPPDQPVPPEAIRGGWEVDPQGRLTGRFRRYRRT